MLDCNTVNSFIAFNSLGDGGAGSESSENVDAVSMSVSGGGGNENIESKNEIKQTKSVTPNTIITKIQ